LHAIGYHKYCWHQGQPTLTGREARRAQGSDTCGI
jgi:hypothetical protein